MCKDTKVSRIIIFILLFLYKIRDCCHSACNNLYNMGKFSCNPVDYSVLGLLYHPLSVLALVAQFLNSG